MVADDADAAARVIERLLVDPAFRAEFRRDPAQACRDAGLDELADEMALGAGNAMQALDVRESRSSVAGVMMAAAFEGVGIFQVFEHGAPLGLASAPAAVSDLLSRVSLPSVAGKVGDLHGSLAPRPDPTVPGYQAATPAADPSEAAAPAATADPSTSAADPSAGPPATSADPAGPVVNPSASSAASPSGPSAANASAAPADPSATSSDPSGPAASADPAATSADPSATSSGSSARGSGDPPETSPGGGAEPAEPRAPLDVASFGAEGGGGRPSPEALALLENKKVVLDGDGVTDIKAGRIDPRVIAVLTKLSEDHKITVSCMCSDHPELTTGGSVSNHHLGRGVDIAAIDGVPVNANSPVAREVATQLGSLGSSYRPDEVGTPWAIAAPGYFTDADHADHLHVGFKQAIDPGWKPPAGLAAAKAPGTLRMLASESRGQGNASHPPRQANAARPDPPAAPQPEPAPASQPAQSPAATASQPEQRPATAAAANVAEQADQAVAAKPAAGAKALAALDEAMKHKGTPYVWGGSDPRTGFDCSGLVQWAYAKQGIQIPRVTDQQILAKNGTSVERTDLAPGDLVFFRDPSGYVHHVGISMGGDKFLHAPHTGDVVKVSSLDEPYYAQQFTGGRRFDTTPAGGPGASPAAVNAAGVSLARDAAAVRNPTTLVFKALSRQEASNHNSTVQFLRAVRPEDAAAPGQPDQAAAPGDPAPVSGGGSLEYPGDNASKQQLAAWLGAQAEKAGLPPELPVMAALVESGLANLGGGDRDSVGFFQMRVGIWNTGEYAGYPERPELQAKWFLDQALALKKSRTGGGEATFGRDPSTWGNWIADVERPAAEYRGRYQMRLEEARRLLGRAG